MTRVGEFDTFYDSTRRYIVHLTYALCGDRNTAAAAASEAYQRAWQHWSRLRTQDSVAYLRNEAWRLSLFERGTHPWRRRKEDDSDLELITALQKLSQNARRLIVLQTLGEVSLESAARDVGMTDDAAIEGTTRAIDELETSLSIGLDDIEERLRGLSRVTDHITLPRASSLRRRARQRTRRNSIVGVAAAALVVVGAGLVTTQHSPLNRADASPKREQIGATTTPAADPDRGIGVDQLLDTAQVEELNTKRGWTITDTQVDKPDVKPFAACARKTFPDNKPARTYLRSFTAAGSIHETSTQAIEISHTADAAAGAYKRLMKWYANCSEPRVQLVKTFRVNHAPAPTQIIQLRSWAAPAKTVTVAVTRAGAAVSVLEHEIDGAKGPSIKKFAATASESVAKICTEAGGACPASAPVQATLPMPTTHEKAFLGEIDLPPVADVDSPWAGTKPGRADPNPAATLCDEASYDGKQVETARARVFVIPEAKKLPEQFGLSETVARFTRTKDAKRFVASVAKKLDKCPKANLSASLDQESKVSGPGVVGRTWRVTFEVDSKTSSFYRVGLVRRGRDVAQVSFSPTKAFDVEPAAFTALAERAAERLAYMR